MNKQSHNQIIEKLLKYLAEKGEMKIQDFVKEIPRRHKNYLDFYPLAALLHSNYVSTDSKTNAGGVTIDGKLGFNNHETALFLYQISLPLGESFEVNGIKRESAHDFPLQLFMTAEGYLRLDELEQRKIERRRKRIDYIVSLSIAVLAVLISSYLTHYYASKRLQLERNQSSSIK